MHFIYSCVYYRGRYYAAFNSLSVLQCKVLCCVLLRLQRINFMNTMIWTSSIPDNIVQFVETFLVLRETSKICSNLDVFIF